MNNEEKILAILSKMQTDFSQMQTDFSQMQTDFSQMRADIEELKERTSRIEITQENVVLPRIQLLAEGHTIIQEQIKRLSVIDSMQDDIATLKTAVRFLSQKVEQLEKAM